MDHSNGGLQRRQLSWSQLSETISITSAANRLSPTPVPGAGNVSDISANVTTVQDEPDLGALEAALCAPSFVLILLANTAVIYLVARSWTSRHRQSIPNLLVLALAGTDLLTGLMGYPPRLVSFFYGRWLGGKVLCHITSFAFTLSLTTSQCIVVLMAVERYLSLEKPFLYQKHCTVRRCVSLLALVCFYSLVSAGCGVIAADVTYSEVGDLYRTLPCTPLGPLRSSAARAFSLWTLAQGITFICVLLVSNIVVIKAIKVLEAKAMTCCPRSKEEYLRQMDMIKGIHREFSRLMQVINIAFLVCLLPTLVRTFCNLLPVWESAEADYFAWRLLLTNSMINPLIYGLLRREVRRKFRRWLSKVFKSCRSNRVAHINDDIEEDNLQTYTPTVC